MIVKRYLAREIVNALFIITTILLLAFLSQQVVRYLNYVAIGKIPTNLLLQLVSFEVPYLLAMLLPLGLYLGILLAYGRLYADNEMSILQMSGFGQAKLFRLTLIVAFVISVVILWLMLWVNPQISTKRQHLMESDAMTLHLIQTLIPGRFQVSPDGRHVMYVEKLSRDHQRAENVFLAQEKKSSDTDDNKNANNSEQNPWMLVLADQGYQEKNKASLDQFFVTRDGYRYEGIPGQNDYKIIQFKKYEVRIPQNEDRETHAEVETFSTNQLWQTYKNPYSAAEFQWRFSIALSALFLSLLAVPFSQLRPRQGRYITIFPAILIYIIYINLLYIARHWVEQTILPISIGMWWVHGLVLLFIIAIIALMYKPGLSKRT